MNFAAILMILQEISNHGVVRALNKSSYGIDIIQMLDIREYTDSRSAWERKTLSRLARMGRKQGLAEPEGGGADAPRRETGGARNRGYGRDLR